jgi:YbbR domain-containing protein
VDGAKRLVNSIYDVKVIVDVTNLDSSFTTKEKLSIIDSKGNEINELKTNIDVVEVSIPIVKTKEVTLKANVEGDLPRDCFLGKVSINPEKVLIVESEKASSVTELNADSIDLRKINATTTQKVKILLPDGIKLANSDGFADVTIEIKKQISKPISFKGSNIKIKDKKSSYMYEILDDSINFNVFGMEDKVNSLTNDMISISASVRDLSEGQYNLTGNVSLPEGIKQRDAVSVLVKVTLIPEAQ